MIQSFFNFPGYPPSTVAPTERPPPMPTTRKSDGESCRLCKEYYPMAEPNEPAGTLLCYSCRQPGWGRWNR